MRTKDSRTVLRGLGRSNAPWLPGALRQRTDAYYQRGERLSYEGTAQQLTQVKKQENTVWLNDVAAVPLQQSLRHLDRAFRNFFEGRAEYPTFHKKHAKQSASYAGTACK